MFADYSVDVQQNITTISKQLHSTEQTLEQFSEDEIVYDEKNAPGLPITEIMEELDEDGNIICSRILDCECGVY